MVHVGGEQGGDNCLSLSSACATVRCRGMYICNRKIRPKGNTKRRARGQLMGQHMREHMRKKPPF